MLYLSFYASVEFSGLINKVFILFNANCRTESFKLHKDVRLSSPKNFPRQLEDTSSKSVPFISTAQMFCLSAHKHTHTRERHLTEGWFMNFGLVMKLCVYNADSGNKNFCILIKRNAWLTNKMQRHTPTSLYKVNE